MTPPHEAAKLPTMPRDSYLSILTSGEAQARSFLHVCLGYTIPFHLVLTDCCNWTAGAAVHVSAHLLFVGSNMSKLTLEPS